MTVSGIPDHVHIPGMAGQRILVLGFGLSGQATARAISESGGRILVADDKADGRALALGQGFEVLDPDTALADAAMDMIVAAPGIPFTPPRRHPRLMEADALHVPVVCDVFLWREAFPDAKLVLVTGSNGKSSTTALIEHALNHAGRSSVAAGNIGRPVLTLNHKNPLTIYVFELSSYQLDLVGGLDPAVSVWLNLSSDHLDRHGDMAQYHRAKSRIFLGGKASHQVVIGADDEISRALVAGFGSVSAANLTRVSGRDGGSTDFGVHDRVVCKRHDGSLVPVVSLQQCPNLDGAHNAQNAAAATAVLRHLGLEPEEIEAAFETYQGLPHRSRLVGTLDGVRFINDSKATNVESARPHFLDGDPVYWLAGGRPKPGGFGALEGVAGRVARGYFFGEAAIQLEADLGSVMSHRIFDTLDEAFAAACLDLATDRPASARCLLAPACASFDQFSSFSARGDHFEALVRQHLAKEEAS